MVHSLFLVILAKYRPIFPIFCSMFTTCVLAHLSIHNLYTRFVFKFLVLLPELFPNKMIPSHYLQRLVKILHLICNLIFH